MLRQREELLHTFSRHRIPRALVQVMLVETVRSACHALFRHRPRWLREVHLSQRR